VHLEEKKACKQGLPGETEGGKIPGGEFRGHAAIRREKVNEAVRGRGNGDSSAAIESTSCFGRRTSHQKGGGIPQKRGEGGGKPVEPLGKKKKKKKKIKEVSTSRGVNVLKTTLLTHEKKKYMGKELLSSGECPEVGFIEYNHYPAWGNFAKLSRQTFHHMGGEESKKKKKSRNNET